MKRATGRVGIGIAVKKSNKENGRGTPFVRKPPRRPAFNA
jgi:hypothetical protein